MNPITHKSAFLALSLAALVITGCRPPSHDHGHGDGEHDHHEEEQAKGPHGGRLLEEGDFGLEVTIFENGVPPEYRVYPYLRHEPLDPAQVKVSMLLRRPGGRVDQIQFMKQGDYLRGDRVVEEPHSFEVSVAAEHAGQSHNWKYESFEGRAVLTAEVLRNAGVTVETAGPALIPVERALPGEVALNLDRAAHVVSRFRGQVMEVRKTLGDRVRQGEVLAVLDSRELADAKSEFIEAIHRLELAQALFTREEALWRKKISAEKDYLLARHQLEETEIAKQTARQKLLALGVGAAELELLAREPEGEVVAFRARQPFPEQALTRYELRAPRDGTVVGKEVTAGSPVDADQELFLLADLTTVWVDATVHPADLPMVGEGRKATVRLEATGREAAGTIAYVGPLADGRSRASLARLVLPNPDGAWRPGLFVSVRVVESEATVPVAVRTAALQAFRDRDAVFLQDGDVFQAMPVTLGRRNSEWVEVLSGLSAGQRYASTNSFVIKAEVLKDGATHDH